MPVLRDLQGAAAAAVIVHHFLRPVQCRVDQHSRSAQATTTPAGDREHRPLAVHRAWPRFNHLDNSDCFNRADKFITYSESSIRLPFVRDAISSDSRVRPVSFSCAGSARLTIRFKSHQQAALADHFLRARKIGMEVSPVVCPDTGPCFAEGRRDRGKIIRCGLAGIAFGGRDLLLTACFAMGFR